MINGIGESSFKVMAVMLIEEELVKELVNEALKLDLVKYRF
jgi:hypothetical protein